MNKDEVYEIKIEDLSNDGEGIGHADEGMAIFVKDALPCDYVRVKIIKAKKNYAYGRLMEIIEPSPFRVEAVCPNSRRCGGCSIMHIDYAKQKEYKWNKVKSCLERIGGLKNAADFMEPVIGMDNPFCYRNKMQFPVGLDKNGRVNIGFYAGRTHSIIDMEGCAIGHPVNNYLVRHLRSWLQDRADADSSYIYNELSHKGLVRHILTRVGYTTGELMVCLVINGSSLAGRGRSAELVNESLIEVLGRAVEEYNKIRLHDGESTGEKRLSGNSSAASAPRSGLASVESAAVRSNCKAGKISLSSVSININTDKTNRILGATGKTIWGKDYITDYIGDVCFNISPLSFYQVNPVQTKVLYDKAIEYAALTGNETVWDMYCGIGTISLSMAASAGKVYGVEIVPQAIEDARNNARLNNISNVEFYCGKAEEVVPAYLNGELGNPDTKAKCPEVIVVDPPRKGCDEALLETISLMNPNRLVYVSCDPATLARDIRILGEKGYTVQKAAVVDQFCHSTHVETVVLIQRADT